MLAGLVLLFALLLGLQAFASAPAAALARAVRILAVVLGFGVALFLLFKGQAILAAIPAFIAFAASNIFRSIASLVLSRMVGNAFSGRGASFTSDGGAGTSEVCGILLRMTLDHVSGAMEGEVLEGSLTGRALSSLSDDELSDLLRACSERCERSRRLLETWLDRHRGGDWRANLGAGTGGHAHAASGPMSREEAFRMLGLEEGASPDEIRSTHRRLSRRLHPDAGGTDHLAAMINEARDTLLDD